MHSRTENTQRLQELNNVQQILEYWHEHAELLGRSYLAAGVDMWGNDWGDERDQLTIDGTRNPRQFPDGSPTEFHCSIAESILRQ